jgi:group I intron endonuclease
MITGVYKIASIAKPDRIYIGSSIDIYKRWEQHLRNLRKDKHHSQKLQRHFNKYGKSDLVFSVIIGCDKDELINVEQYYIDIYEPYFNGSMKAYSNGGFTQTEGAKQKISESMKGEKNPNYGREFSEEHRKRLSESMKGRTSPNKGKKASDETRKKQSDKRKGIRVSPATEFKKGQIFSDDTKAKISAAKKGKPTWNKGKKYPHKGHIPSEETREKLRQAGTGRTHSEETKKKMSEARSKYYMMKKLTNVESLIN